MNPFLIVGGILAIFAFAKKAIPSVPNKAGGSLGLAANPSTSSSTPVPTPSANSPNATPPFFQQSNSATPSEPHTTQSFDPIELSGSPTSGSQDRQGVLATPVRTPTIHNNIVLAKTFGGKLSTIQRPISKQYISETEQTSISEEQDYAINIANGTPDNPQVNSSLAFVNAKINNAGGSNGTHSATPYAGILQYAHRLAPTPPKQTTIEKNIPKIANSIVKASLKPNPKVTKPTVTAFHPLSRVYEA